MRTFGKADREEGAPASPSALDLPVSILDNPSAKREQAASGPVMSASLRERIIEQIEPSVAATVPREVLRRQIEEIIHQIANQERLETLRARAASARRRTRRRHDRLRPAASAAD